MILRTSMIVLVFLSFIANSTKVSFKNLLGFFNTTIDSNKDGFSKIDEFVNYYRFMEPEHNLTEIDLRETF